MSAKQKVAATVAPSSIVAARATGSGAAEYSLTAERSAALTAQANAVTPSGASFPGRLAQRIRRFGEIRLAAERDAADLVRTPFHGEPPITAEEIHEQRDRIEFLRITESRYQALRGTQKQAFTEFETFGAEAAAIRARLLRTFDVRFAKDAKGKKRVSAIREGSGDPDLVQDVSDLLVLCGEHVAYLAGCPRGESADVARLGELSPTLSHLLAAKGMGEEAVTARKLRDGAYALVMQTESRLRIGATYWYEGMDKLRDYAMFVVPAKGSAAELADPADVGEPVSPAAPAVPA